MQSWDVLIKTYKIDAKITQVAANFYGTKRNRERYRKLTQHIPKSIFFRRRDVYHQFALAHHARQMISRFTNWSEDRTEPLTEQIQKERRLSLSSKRTDRNRGETDGGARIDRRRWHRSGTAHHVLTECACDVHCASVLVKQAGDRSLLLNLATRAESFRTRLF